MYKIYDIFCDAGALIIVTIAQVIWEYIAHRNVAKTQIFIAILVAIFGGANLYFHNEEFIKGKVSIMNWLMGIGLIITTYTMKEP
ncbi:septation protein IspZ, partial [Francisella tularensis]|uniref:septation protein IspZ n=1 Tax=Francisella tularensis TaxID=263 RepID=UPI0023819981